MLSEPAWGLEQQSHSRDAQEMNPKAGTPTLQGGLVGG